MLGPKQQLLASYVASADPERLDAAGQQWTTAEGLLRRLSEQLGSRSQVIGTDHRFSGESAKAAKTAFSQSSTKMNDRADQMREGAAAFAAAAHAVRQATRTSSGFAPNAGTQPPPQPPDLSDAAAQKDWNTKNNQFWNHYQGQETAAGDAITALQDNHRTQAAVFAKIHGEQPPVPPPPPGRNPVSTGTAPPVTHVPGGHLTGSTPIDTDPTGGGHHNPPGVPVPHPPSDPGVPTPPVHHQPPPITPGVPQGPGTSPGGLGGGVGGGTGGVGPIGGVGSGGGGIGAVGGVGAVAGGALGGAAAAGLAGGLSGGLNGGVNGLMPLNGGRGGLSASGVRGIGATSRTGVGSVLGRGSGATGRAGAGGMSTRGGGGGGRGGGRSAGSRGSRGRAGARGAGAGGAGRKGKDKKGNSADRDLFDDGSDWIDDEDAAPGLID